MQHRPQHGFGAGKGDLHGAQVSQEGFLEKAVLELGPEGPVLETRGRERMMSSSGPGRVDESGTLDGVPHGAVGRESSPNSVACLYGPRNTSSWGPGGH